MLDQSEKGSEAGEIISRKLEEAESQQKKTCADCGTTKTPLWRGGPAGPKSLCNACGIRSRKKKRDVLGLTKGAANEKKSRKGSSYNHNNHLNNHRQQQQQQLGDGLKQRFLALDGEALMQRPKVRRPRNKLGEEEQAAVLLMALSYGSVYA
uniref:Uncharacterized protein MANES_03G201300 n=1 Tax=Rhizophora mucronata TaxID=61149 RepID=A0A2P2Q3C3_RHIMU